MGVVGLGLIGGSLARRLAAAGRPVSGWDNDAGTRAEARAAGLTVPDSLEALAAQGGVMFVAVPLPALDAVFASIAAAAPPGTVLSDVTSVKQPVRALAGHHLLTFVGGHPMAGTAESGFAAGSAQLLADATWVLTLDEETSLAAWLIVAALVTALGCQVVPCTSATHDEAVARVSHLPHVLAAALVLEAADDPLARSLAAGAFRDATRVAATRAQLVAAMCGGNADALDARLMAFVARLEQARGVLGKPDELTEWFAAAHDTRREWPALPSLETHVAADADLRRRLLDAGIAGGHVVQVRSGGVVMRTSRRPSAARDRA